jgi:hypothetical protein
VLLPAQSTPPLDEAKAALPPDRFAALWAEGRALTADEAVARALEQPR